MYVQLVKHLHLCDIIPMYQLLRCVFFLFVFLTMNKCILQEFESLFFSKSNVIKVVKPEL